MVLAVSFMSSSVETVGETANIHQVARILT